MYRTRFLLLAGLLAGTAAWAADHADGPRASADPAADVNDVFAWMSPDASRLELVMSVVRFAAPGAVFSDGVRYTFQTTSMPAFGGPESSPVNVDCTFDAAQNITCRLGDEVVSGDASNPAGITSPTGALRVFAGRRNDPFFFNLEGFRRTSETVTSVAGDLAFDGAGCPQLDGGTAAALQEQLRTDANGNEPAPDNFGGADILAIVVSVEKSLVTRNGPIVSVWGRTSRR